MTRLGLPSRRPSTGSFAHLRLSVRRRRFRTLAIFLISVLLLDVSAVVPVAVHGVAT